MLTALHAGVVHVGVPCFGALKFMVVSRAVAQVMPLGCQALFRGPGSYLREQPDVVATCSMLDHFAISDPPDVDVGPRNWFVSD